MHHFAFIPFGFIWHFLLNIQNTVRALFSRGCSSLPEQLDLISKMFWSTSCSRAGPLIHCLKEQLWHITVVLNSPSRYAMESIISFYLSWHHCFLLVSLMCGSHQPTVMLLLLWLGEFCFASAGICKAAPLACCVCFHPWPSRAQEHFHLPCSCTASASQRMTYWFE